MPIDFFLAGTSLINPLLENLFSSKGLRCFLPRKFFFLTGNLVVKLDIQPNFKAEYIGGSDDTDK